MVWAHTPIQYKKDKEMYATMQSLHVVNAMDKWRDNFVYKIV